LIQAVTVTPFLQACVM